MSPRIGLNLDQIVTAAAEIADEHGIQQITLSTVAQKLNVRSPSLYNHVDGLPGLRRAMALKGLEQLREIMMQAAVGRSRDTAIREVARAYLQFVRTQPGLYEATFYQAEQNDPSLNKVANQLLELLFQILREFELTDDGLIHAGRGLRSVLHGFSSLERNHGFGLKVDVDTSFEIIITAFLHGLQQMKKDAPSVSSSTDQ
ncbi:TetR/AcrR family transcriptional regulator [Paenibacillus kandeliae]|uniref:TetR/AcrR family transcriptional regulator n=1 Tax=Paenibacillus kandeliae TaxID=3231269 RepID=UPI0034574F0C